MTNNISNFKVPRTAVFSYGAVYDECIKILIDRKRIEFVRFDGYDDSNNSFTISRLLELGMPKNFARNVDIPLSEEMIADYPEFFKQHFSTFWSFLNRQTYTYGISSFDQMAAYFNILYRYFYHVLKSNDIEFLIIFLIPHVTGYDEILYQVAKKMNIKILFCHPSCFQNTTFILPDIEAILDHQQLLTINDDQILEIKNETPYYMHDILQKQKIKFTKYFPRPLRFLYKTITNLSFLFKDVYSFVSYKKNQIKSNVNKHIILVPLICKGIKFIWMNIFYAIEGALLSEKFMKLSKCETEIDWNTKYVYFPLHLQPEMTTSPLGGVYENQLYAIECIAQIIPNDWKIFVKENPKQFIGVTGKPSYWRDTAFFLKRIQRIPKIVLVRENIDTNLLIEKSEFVATITGTAGWEAILCNKSVLFFGMAWYGSFSGCTQFTSKTTLDDILCNKPNREKIQCAIKQLAGKLAKGILLHAQSKTITDFDVNSNAKNMANAMEKYIDHYFPKISI
jgi:hypothetical protein